MENVNVIKLLEANIFAVLEEEIGLQSLKKVILIRCLRTCGVPGKEKLNKESHQST